MEKINVEKLGEEILEYRDGVPFTSHTNPMKAVQEVAEKVNELIDKLKAEVHPNL